jgi:hypothetical protein
LIDKQDLNSLTLISCYPIVNAYKLVAMVNEERGINGLTPAELLHWILLGLFIYLVDGLLNLKKIIKHPQPDSGSKKVWPTLLQCR